MLNDWLVVAIIAVLVYLFLEATADNHEGLRDGTWANAQELNRAAGIEAKKHRTDVYAAHDAKKRAVDAFLGLTAVRTRIDNLISDQVKKYSDIADKYRNMGMETLEMTQREKISNTMMDKELDDKYNKLAQDAATDLQDARDTITAAHNTLVSAIDSNDAFMRKYLRILNDKKWGAVPNEILQINEKIAAIKSIVTNTSDAEIVNKHNMVTRAIDSRASAIEGVKQRRDSELNALVERINEKLRQPSQPTQPSLPANRLEFKPVQQHTTFATVPKLPVQIHKPLRPNVQMVRTSHTVNKFNRR